MAFHAGQLRHRVAIQRRQYLQDSAGDPIQNPDTGELRLEWVTYATVWADVHYSSAREFVAAGAQLSEAAGWVVLRWFSGFLASDRMVHLKTDGDVVLNPKGRLPDADSGREYYTIPFGEGASEGQ